ncbi:hypothetical protein BDZ89DRAFT_1069825 [Hymenopellis radicata]|nr:hypothetical protein BDZ89DRAFT_1069825 [Hymenopellis radicata]
MARSLRPRKSTVNYARLARGDTSESDEVPDDAAPVDKDAEADDDKDEDMASVVDDNMDIDEEPVISRARKWLARTPPPSCVPLHSPTTDVERLVSKPSSPFVKTNTTLTKSFTHNSKTTDRVNKAWGYNVGSGPVWELVEDRAWFKEAQAGAETEDDRRPVVHSEIKTSSEFKMLTATEATPYLPSDVLAADDGTLNPPPPVTCFLGPHDAQTSVQFSMFESRKNSDFIPESKAQIFNPGAPYGALTGSVGRHYTQYLAVAPFPTKNHSPDVGIRAPRPALACIQIWACDASGMRCETVLCVESGPAYDLKWCPLPSHDKTLKRLGFLGGTFEDGTFSVYASGPSFVHIADPIIRIEMVETACWSFDWANSDVVAIGTTNGVIVDYAPDKPTVVDILPTIISQALTWIRVPPCSADGKPRLDGNPTVIASGGYDGMECMTDIREGRGSVMNRTRDVINTMIFSPYAGGPITIDHENIVKAYSASPSMLGRGHTLLEPGGPVWCISTSDMHPQLAVACADGALSTTNMLRSTRRGGSVPFWIHKIYQLDYSRKTGEFRMLERFLPTELAPTSKTGAWPREVGVQRVAWNVGNGLGCAGMLASATGSGLCRVDCLEGRWMKDKFPYGDVERLRGGTAVVDDSESE